MSFADDIERAAGGEAIEAIVIGPFGWGGSYAEDRITRPAPARRGELLSWEHARPMLDYEYDPGFGAAECDAIYAWTSTRVLHVNEYDGATGVVAIPRHPTTDPAPEMGGRAE